MPRTTRSTPRSRGRFASPPSTLGLLSLLAWVSLLGCSAEGGEPSATGQGGSEPAGLPTPASVLAPSSYDCTATGPFLAPERPHATDCFAEASCTSPLVAAHRIATPFAPENSLSALRAAILLGVDVAESDVRLTQDGEVVLLHDAEVDRTLVGRGKIDELTLAEVRAMEMKSDGKPGDFSCDRLPTLAEALALAGDEIVVELEVKNTAAGVKTAEYLRDHDGYRRAFLLCDPDECDAVRAAVPDVPIMTRPRAPDEVAAAVGYAPPPELVHIDATEGVLTPEILGAIAGAGAKPYANAFLNADLAALGSGKIDGYLELYASGLGVVQTELPHAVLMALSRL